MSQDFNPGSAESQPTIPQLAEAITSVLQQNAELHATLRQLQAEVVSLRSTTPTPAPIDPTPVVTTTAPANTVPTIPTTLPDFKMPSIKPLPFSGNQGNRPAHELQNILDDYLERSLEICQLYGLAPDITRITKNGQPTYVQFVSMGLADNARILWRQIPAENRLNMTWNDYVKWINLRFGSQLTLSQAIEAMDSLRQTRSAVIYSCAFNELVAAISASGVTYPDAISVSST